MSEEYKVLVGQGTAGDFVKETQGVAEGFSSVSQFWFPQTLSYDECIENLERERSNREDIVSAWEDWSFDLDGRELVLKYADGRQFKPTENALTDAVGYSDVLPSHVKKTLDPSFEADDVDLTQLVDTLNYRKRRQHKTNKNENRELRFRTYGDNSLRAVLSTLYAPIDNRWLIELMSDLIPDGRVSHLRGDADSIFANILMPDNVRQEEDSEYGGMFSIQNSEIGRAALDGKPSLFRAICRNGCIWSQTEGISYRTVHKGKDGKIDLSKLAVNIGDNLNKQIPMLPAIMDKFLALRRYEFHEVNLTGVFAAVGERFRMKPSQINDVIEQFVQFEKTDRTAFGILNAITRAGQLYDFQTTNDFDKIGGTLITENWDNLVKKANAYSRDDIARLLGASA